MKNSAKPVTTCQYQSVVSSCFMSAMCVAIRAVLPVARRELAQRERRVRDEQREDGRRRAATPASTAAGRRGNSPRRCGPRSTSRPCRAGSIDDEEHVHPHEQAEREAGAALQQVEPRRPARWRRGAVEAARRRSTRHSWHPRSVLGTGGRGLRFRAMRRAAGHKCFPQAMNRRATAYSPAHGLTDTR